jgi:hypothetical protein
MTDISASGSFKALAEAVRLNRLAKARRNDPAPEDPLLPEAATVIAAH